MSIEALRAKLKEAQERDSNNRTTYPPTRLPDNLYEFSDYGRVEWTPHEECPFHSYSEVDSRIYGNMVKQPTDVFLDGWGAHPYRHNPETHPKMAAILKWLLEEGNASALPELWIVYESEEARHMILRFANDDDAMLFKMRWRGDLS